MNLPAPDWSGLLSPGETLLWSGRPDLSRFAVMAGAIALLSLPAGPGVLLLLALPAGILFFFARDAYALTDRRILLRRQPFLGPPRLDALPRAGTWPTPRLSRGERGLTFTAPDRSRLHFRHLGGKTMNRLIALHAGPQAEAPA